MHAKTLLYNYLKTSLSKIHKKRRIAVENATEALITGKCLTLTQLGRYVESGSRTTQHSQNG